MQPAASLRLPQQPAWNDTGVPVTTFTHAVQRLHAAVNQPDTEFIRDAVIQRFECCYELAWQMRTLQLGRDGIVAQTPRHTI